MSLDSLIVNGKVAMASGLVEGVAVGIAGGKIVNLCGEEYTSEAKEVIDARGRYVIPGFVDSHCHIDVMWLVGAATLDECFRAETSAAVVGGVTTVGPMPIVPSIRECFPSYRAAADHAGLCDSVFHFYASSDRHLQELSTCPNLGIVTIGEMGGYKGRQAAEVSLEYCDDERMYKFMEEIATWGPPARLMLHAENVDVILYLIEKMIATGRRDPAAWSDARPPWTEAEQLRTYVALAKATGCPIHIVHNTCRESLEVLRQAKNEGVDVTAETCPQYLTFTKDTFQSYPPIANVNPPLRETADNEALWRAINDGTIDTMATDHCTWTKQMKGDNVMHAPMGVGNVLSTWLPAMMTYGVEEGKITVEKMVEVCSANPAKMMGIYPKKGAISVGSDADITVIDMDKRTVPKAEDLYSATDINAYEIAGVELVGWAALTMVRGRIVQKDGKIIAEPGVGEYIPVDLDDPTRAAAAASA